MMLNPHNSEESESVYLQREKTYKINGDME